MITAYTQRNPGQLVSDNAGHQVWCNTYKVEALPDSYCVELYSVLHDGAKSEQRTIFAAVLTQAQLQTFQASLAVPDATA